MLKLQLGYPSKEEEVRILDRMAGSAPTPTVNPVMSLQDIATARSAADKIIVDDRIKRYTVDVVNATSLSR